MANNELLLKTLAYIEEHPKEWDQRSWAKGLVLTSPCGTTCCFAGHSVLLSGGTIDWGNPLGIFTYTGPTTIRAAAVNVLGLSPLQAMMLFDANNSLTHLRALVRCFVENPDVQGCHKGCLRLPYTNCAGCKKFYDLTDEYLAKQLILDQSL